MPDLLLTGSCNDTVSKWIRFIRGLIRPRKQKDTTTPTIPFVNSIIPFALLIWRSPYCTFEIGLLSIKNSMTPFESWRSPLLSAIHIFEIRCISSCIIVMLLYSIQSSNNRLSFPWNRRNLSTNPTVFKNGMSYHHHQQLVLLLLRCNKETVLLSRYSSLPKKNCAFIHLFHAYSSTLISRCITLALSIFDCIVTCH